MTQPNVPVTDSAAASAKRHAALTLVATQILGRVLLHNGVTGIPPELVGMGAEVVLDLVSGLLSAATGGIGWLLHRRRNG